MDMAAIGEPARRGDEQKRPRRRHEARQHGGEETERGRRIAGRFGRDLMQRPDGEAAVRQMRIERRESERQGACRRGGAVHPGQQAAQLGHDRGAIASWNTGD